VDGDIYQFTLIAQADLKFQMVPTGFRGAMGLYRGVYGDPDPKLIFEVFGPGSAPFGARAYLPAGQYFLMAGPSGRSGGMYTVQFTPSAATDCAVFDWTDFGADINGAVTTADCSAASGNSQDVYGIWLEAGEAVQVTGAAGAKPMSVLFRRQGDGSAPNLVERNLAAAGSSTFSFVPTTKGVYAIHVVGAASSIGAVSYTLQVRTP
jgi:hypothetical protein